MRRTLVRLRKSTQRSSVNVAQPQRDGLHGVYGEEGHDQAVVSCMHGSITPQEARPSRKTYLKSSECCMISATVSRGKRDSCRSGYSAKRYQLRTITHMCCSVQVCWSRHPVVVEELCRGTQCAKASFLEQAQHESVSPRDLFGGITSRDGPGRT